MFVSVRVFINVWSTTSDDFESRLYSAGGRRCRNQVAVMEVITEYWCQEGKPTTFHNIMLFCGTAYWNRYVLHIWAPSGTGKSVRFTQLSYEW